MRSLLLPALLIACGEETGDPELEAARADYVARFPALYCAWLRTCPWGEYGVDRLDGDCEGHYEAVMAAESELHEIFVPHFADYCLWALTPGDPHYETCKRWRENLARPEYCWIVTSTLVHDPDPAPEEEE